MHSFRSGDVTELPWKGGAMWTLVRNRKYLIGSVALLLLVGLVYLLRGDPPVELPKDLNSRAKYVGEALVRKDRPAFDRLVGESGRRHAGQWYEELQTTLPEVFRNPQLRIEYSTETKYEKLSKGTACLVLKISPGNLDLARNLSDDSSNLDWGILLYWNHDDANGWMLDIEECSKAFRLDRGVNWSGRAADKKTFKQVNK